MQSGIGYWMRKVFKSAGGALNGFKLLTVITMTRSECCCHGLVISKSSPPCSKIFCVILSFGSLVTRSVVTSNILDRTLEWKRSNQLCRKQERMWSILVNLLKCEMSSHLQVYHFGNFASSPWDVLSTNPSRLLRGPKICLMTKRGTLL